MPYCARAQVVLSEQLYGRFRDPTDAELVVIDEYREKYRHHLRCLPGRLPLGRRRAVPRQPSPAWGDSRARSRGRGLMQLRYTNGGAPVLDDRLPLTVQRLQAMVGPTPVIYRVEDAHTYGGASLPRTSGHESGRGFAGSSSSAAARRRATIRFTASASCSSGRSGTSPNPRRHARARTVLARPPLPGREQVLRRDGPGATWTRGFYLDHVSACHY
jgi:hypothetical protein